jgi:hypothetical protein
VKARHDNVLFAGEACSLGRQARVEGGASKGARAKEILDQLRGKAAP